MLILPRDEPLLNNMRRNSSSDFVGPLICFATKFAPQSFCARIHEIIRVVASSLDLADHREEVQAPRSCQIAIDGFPLGAERPRASAAMAELEAQTLPSEQRPRMLLGYV